MSVIALWNKKKKKFELADIAHQLAYNYDLEFEFCAQSVLAAIKDTVGVVSDDVIKAAHSLSGGGSLLGIGTCGALAGGLMAFSCKYGRDSKNFGKGQFMKGILKGRLLVKRFENEYGVFSCNDIQKKYTGRTFDIWDADETKEFREKFCNVICPQVCGNVAKWVVELI
jgi:C_GCAxxG_C_C family probable redox protein